MSVYDGSIIKVSNNLELDTTITQLSSKLPCKPKRDATSGLISTTSASVVTCHSTSHTVELDDITLFTWAVSCSVTNVDTVIDFVMNVNAVNYTPNQFVSSSLTSSAGDKMNASGSCIVENLSGAITWTLQYYRSVGTGTCWVNERVINLMTFKKRA